MISDENLEKTLKFDYAVLRSYNDVAMKYGISKGLAYKIINYGHTPVKSEIRKRMGLPELKIVEGCLKCGGDHRRKSCSSNNMPRHRLSINLDSPQSAARSIKDHMGRNMMKKLIEILKEE